MSIQRLAVSIAVMLLASVRAVHAQSATPADSGSETGAPRSLWRKVAGTAAPDAVYLGWATWHLRYPMKPLMNNHFWGATYRGFHAGTFITSHDDRGYVVGVQRVLAAARGRAVSAELGYRAGLIYGYDEEFLAVAGRIPVLPALTGMVDLTWKTLGLQITYAGIVMTVGGVVRF
jgi:hypothetical protein